MAQGGDAQRTQEARRGNPGARLRSRTLYPDRTMEAGDRLSQEPERGHPGARIPDVERREDLSGLMPCRTVRRASGRARRRWDRARRIARYWPPPAAAACPGRVPVCLQAERWKGGEAAAYTGNQAGAGADRSRQAPFGARSALNIASKDEMRVGTAAGHGLSASPAAWSGILRDLNSRTI